MPAQLQVERAEYVSPEGLLQGSVQPPELNRLGQEFSPHFQGGIALLLLFSGLALLVRNRVKGGASSLRVFIC